MSPAEAVAVVEVAVVFTGVVLTLGVVVLELWERWSR